VRFQTSSSVRMHISASRSEREGGEVIVERGRVVRGRGGGCWRPVRWAASLEEEVELPEDLRCTRRA